jgi:hypothetical protein
MAMMSDWRKVPAIFRQRYVVGVDLGQSADPTAIAILHWKTVPCETWTHENFVHRQDAKESLEVRYLQRLALGQSYPEQVQHVADMLARPPLCGDDDFPAAELVIDETGVGRAVGDIFETAGMKPFRVSITAGAEATVAGHNRHHVAKSILISTLDARLHTGELKFAAALTEADAMREELLDFRRKVSTAGRYSFEARVGKHDDLVLATSIALWWMVRPPPPAATFGYY